MTREERENAIEWFTMLKEKFVNTVYEKYLEMAIKSLEQEPKTDNQVKPEIDRVKTELAQDLDVLDKIRAEIEQMPSELTADGRRMIRRGSVFRIIDKYRQEG